MTQENFTLLIRKYGNNNISQEEEQQLLECLANPEYEQLAKSLIGEYWDKEMFKPLLSGQDSEKIYETIRNKYVIAGKIVVMQKKEVWKKWVAAASVVLVFLCASVYFLFAKKRAVKQENQTVALTDIAPPVSSNAVLFFDDGTRASVTNASDIASRTEKGVHITQSENKRIVDYTERTGKAVKEEYNTLFNPRGSRSAILLLADGSRVWLNAESSIRYPVYFIGNERRVQVSGEAYFEVAKQKDKPFIVTNGKTEIRVLGTHFNVNTYNKDNVVVTLLEGSVQISKGSIAGILKPGEEASIDTGIAISDHSNITKAIAWKDEVFNFTKTSIADIMDQIERWYDVKVEYEGLKPAITLSGTINRNINASSVLEMLSLSSGLRFRIDGKKNNSTGKIEFTREVAKKREVL